MRGVARGGVSRRRWPSVLRTLREDEATLENVAACLRQRGHWEEATVLDTAGELAWGEEHAARAMSPLCAGYPAGWRAMGDAAPPILWRRGVCVERPLIGAVGSREVGPAPLTFAEEIGARTAALGRSLVSGGAEGCDSAAARGALDAGGSVVRILPHGLGLWRLDDAFYGGVECCDLSLCAPDEPFSTGAAMERNALIYAAGEATVVAHARYKVGGTWHGATEALRRRRGRLIVRDDYTSATPMSPAHRALAALGATVLANPNDLAAALAEGPVQGNLFSFA